MMDAALVTPDKVEVLIQDFVKKTLPFHRKGTAGNTQCLPLGSGTP